MRKVVLFFMLWFSDMTWPQRIVLTLSAYFIFLSDQPKPLRMGLSAVYALAFTYGIIKELLWKYALSEAKRRDQSSS